MHTNKILINVILHNAKTKRLQDQEEGTRPMVHIGTVRKASTKGILEANEVLPVARVN
jgi:hypothetical protein